MSNPWTPGPWRTDDSRRVIFGGDLAVALVRSDEDAALIAASPEMAAELADVASVFEHYAALHRAKGTQDGDAKAETNAAFAGRIRALLARIRGEAA